MRILILGAGMMGRAIAYDLCNHSNFENITIADKDRKTLQSAKKFLEKGEVNFDIINIEKTQDVKKYFQDYAAAISAVPYRFNYFLAKTAIETKTHFLDLGGNNNIVNPQGFRSASVPLITFTLFL